VSSISREFRLTLESAVREAMARRHAHLTVEHLLYALLHDERGAEILRAVGVGPERLKRDLLSFFEESIDKVPGEGPVQSQQTLAFHRVLEAALHQADSSQKPEIDAGDVLAAIFQEPDSHAMSLLRSRGVSRLDVLRYVSHGIRKASASEDLEDSHPGMPEIEGDGEGEGAVADPLGAFSVNLTEKAAAGALDPLIGRRAELERAIHILARRRKNNPIFVGESGVGKTAVAEGLAQRIHEGRVPPDLRNAEIFAVDLGAMLAGTRYRGDFEARFKAFIAAVQRRENPIVFIDEIHTVLGAGSANGATVDASNMLKPLLQSGELRCMGSTTYQEYRHFEKDRALARRFQRVEIQEPTLDETVRILEGLAPRYESHHGVHYTHPALRAAAELSSRHLVDRFLPDKAIDVMDEAGAAVRLAPGARKTVGVRDVEATVSRIARVPLRTSGGSEREKLEHLEEELRGVVFGQNEAIATVVRAVKRSRAGLGGTQRPVGCFLFMGPTGVGKTELAKQLARSLSVEFLRFDMSEYVEKHAVARLIGAPPGYVGYDEGGILVERVRKHPHSVLLLDEIEKAHPDLFDVLLQVMDHATLTDNHGREADFRHVTLIMTSNVGARDMTARAIGFGRGSAGDGQKEVERLFSPEFRNRLDETVTFAQLTPEVMERVVDKFIAELQEQLRERKVRLVLAPQARAWLAERGFDPLYGARPLGRVIQTEVKDRIAEQLLFGALEKGGEVRIDCEGSGAAAALRFAFSARAAN
jgi:ATP-dependent Clp protease ATP-binding subunit ClpA